MVLKLTAIFMLLLCTVILSQKAENDVFKHINLDYPGLENVNKAYLNSDLLKAKEELLVYFQNRTNRKYADDEYPGNISKADMNAENIFVIKSIKQNFGAKVDWTTIKGEKNAVGTKSPAIAGIPSGYGSVHSGFVGVHSARG